MDLYKIIQMDLYKIISYDFSFYQKIFDFNKKLQ